MEFSVLGPLEVLEGDRPIALGGAKQRTLLAYLLLHANTAVPVDRLIDVLWADDPPETAAHTLHVYISQLRKVLHGSARNDVELTTEGRGYALRLPEGSLDLHRFLKLAEAGRRSLGAGDLDAAAAELKSALSIWRGDPLSDLPYGALPSAEIARLDESRLVANEDRIDADLKLGRQEQLVGELTDLVDANPLRERLRGQQMLALYRSGRQAEALQSYRVFQRTIGEELGIDPSQPLQSLERRILQQDPDLGWSSTAVEPSGPPKADAARTRVERRVRGRHRPSRLVVGGVIAFSLVVLTIAGLRWSPSEHRPSVVGPNSVGRIDPTNAELAASIPTAGTGPGPITWAYGSLWVANTTSGTVARVSGEDRVAQSVPTDGAPTDIAAGVGAVWVLDGFDGTVLAIDPQTSKVIATITVPQGSGGIAVGGGFVWVTNTIETTVTKINPESQLVVDTIRLGPPGSGDPKAIAADSRFVWVADELAPALWQIDAMTDQVVSNPGLRGVASAIAVAPDGRVWIASYKANLLASMEAPTLQTTTFEVSGGPTDIASGADRIWVALALDGTVDQIDPSSGAVIGATEVGGSPQGLAVGGGSVWVSRPA